MDDIKKKERELYIESVMLKEAYMELSKEKKNYDRCRELKKKQDKIYHRQQIKKNQVADIPTKNGNSYSYQYVDIAQIHEYLESINSKYIQKIERIDGDDYIMTKRCFDNKWEEEWLQGSRVVDATLFGNDNPAQKQGSALTYARRYSLLMAYGLATEDDDANSLNSPKELTKEDAESYAGSYTFKTGKKQENTLI